METFKSGLERYRQQVGLTLVFLILIGGGVLAFSGKSGPKEEISIVKSEKTGVPEGTAAAEVAAPLPALITVEAAGAVLNPGVYELLAGSRVVEVLDQAGGLSDQADKDWVAKNLNLAAKLSDGDKIYLPAVGEMTEPGVVSGSTVGATETLADKCDKVNLNSATAAALDECLPGIGPAYAQRIIEYRQAHGGFKAIEEIQNVSGIGPKTFEKIKDQITVD